MKRKSKPAVSNNKTVVPLKVKRKDSFFESVFDVVRLIPKGRATSFGAIAAYLGNERGRHCASAGTGTPCSKPQWYAKRETSFCHTHFNGRSFKK